MQSSAEPPEDNMESALKTLAEAIQTRPDKGIVLAIIKELREAVAGERFQHPHTVDLFQRLLGYSRRSGLLDSVDPGVWDYLAQTEFFLWRCATDDWTFTIPGCVADILDAAAEGDWPRAVSNCDTLLDLHRATGTYFLGRIYEAMGDDSQARHHLARYGRPSVPERALWDYLIDTHAAPTAADEDRPLMDRGLRTRTLIYLASNIGSAWQDKDWPAALRACRQIEEEMQARDLADYFRARTYEQLGDRAGAQGSLRHCLETTQSPALGAEAAERLRRLAG